MAVKRDSFVFYKSWNNVISDLSKDVQWEVYHAITEYAINGNLVELKPVAKVAFAFIKQDIDRAFEKYEDVQNSRSNAGQMGNLKRWHKDLYDKVVSGGLSLKKAVEVANHRKLSQTSLNVDVDDNVNDNVDDVEEKEFPPPSHGDSQNLDLENEDLEPKSETEKRKKVPPKKEKKRATPEFIVENYHTFCPLLPKIKKLTDARKRRIRARQKEFEDADIATAFKNAGESKFLRGENPRGWMANFDWIMKSENFVKILENNYENRKNKNNCTNNESNDEELANAIAQGLSRGRSQANQRQD